MFRKGSSRVARILALAFIVAMGVVTATMPAFAGSGGFSNTGSLNVARINHTATLLANGEVIVTGGNNNATGYLSSAEIYDPSKGKWTLTGSMTIAREGHDAVLLPNGQVLVTGGHSRNRGLNTVTASAELYTP